MLKQTSIDFEVHRFENNPSSQVHLNNNRTKFSAKCQTVYEWLMKGERLKVLECANKGVSSLPRRIKDLRDNGVLISDEWEGEVKVYFMDKDQIEFNRNLK